MNATRRLLIFIAVLGFGTLAPSPSRAAEVPCSQRVLTDWSDNGRIDRVYALSCYEEALAALPTDLRDYTNAHDVIDRAFTSVARGKTVAPVAEAQALKRQTTIDVSTALPVPIPLLVLFGLALALLAAGALGRVVRRATLGRKETPR